VLDEDPVERSGVILQVRQDEYRYTTFDVDADRYCIYMTRPVNRPLSIVEATDVHYAHVMIADMPIEPKVYTSAEIKAAEASLAELLAAVRSGTHAPMDKKHPLSPLDQGNVVDCSDVTSDERAGGSMQYIYNYFYAWAELRRAHESRCVYLKEPFNRGLDAADARDFLTAPHLRLTPDPPGTPDLERTIKTATERFGGPASANEGLPADLFDCQDFERSPYDSDQNYSQSSYEWMFDGTYVWSFYYFPKGTCLIVSAGEDSRGLTAAEARAFLRAARAGVDDPSNAEMQRVQNCLAKAEQSYGANLPAYESGTINGRRYRVFYAALDPDLKRLDDAQHTFVAERKEVWRKQPATKSRSAAGGFDVEIRIRPTGRTKQLATLEATEAAPDASNYLDSVLKNWMLHIPSGRLLSFEDLFVDSKAARAAIVAAYLRGVPQHVDSIMSSLAFLGDDPQQQARDFRAHYLLESERIATAPADHFVRVQVAADGTRAPYFLGGFSRELLPDEAPPLWSAQRHDLEAYFKPEFRSVLDRTDCPPLPHG
jgi:hypothetical protein